MDKIKSFASRHHDPAPYPEIPESLRSNSVEMSDFAKIQEARADTSPYLTPYLSLRARLSQIWINRWTILLVLVLIRVVILIAQLKTNVGDAKVKALSACTEVEDIGSTMASMPHYLSLGVNDMAASGIETAVKAMVFMLDLILQGVEGLILFFINFMTATYTCLITAMLAGSLDMVASVTEDAAKAFTSVINSAADEIDDIAGSLDDSLNGIIKSIEDSVFGGVLPDIPDVDFSGPVNELKDFEINPDDFVLGVRELADDVPTFEEVQNLTAEAISIPFDFVREKLNETYGGFNFDRDVFPLAQKEQLTFCSDNDTLNSFFDSLFDLIETSRTVFIVVLTLLAVAVMAPMAWLEIQRWRRSQNTARLMMQNRYDAHDVVYIASRPLTSTWGIKIGSHFKGKNQVLVRWCIAYATTKPAFLVLSLALTGFFSCICQAILLKAVQAEVPALVEQVGDFTDQVVSSLGSVSDNWANSANGVIIDLNDDINEDVLGHVTNATDAVNDTLTAFMDTMNNGLEDVFGGTILLDPIMTVVRCTIGIKIESVQKGLTWVHDNAKVSLPLFPNDTFSMGAEASVSGDSDLQTFLASPSSATTDEVSGAVTKVTDWLQDNLKEEALISTGILMVYVIVVLMGVSRMLVGMAMRDKGRGEGGFRYTGEPEPQGAHATGAGFPQFDNSYDSGRAPSYQAQATTGNEKMSGAARGTERYGGF